MARSRKNKTEGVKEQEEPLAEVASDESEKSVPVDAVDGDEHPIESPVDEPPSDGAGDVEMVPREDQAGVAEETIENTGSETVAPDPVSYKGDPAPRKGGFFAPALGGVVAAGLGFGLAVYVMPKLWTPGVSADEVSAFAAKLDAQDGAISALTADVQALSGAGTEELTASEARLTDLVTQLDRELKASDERVTRLTDSIATLDSRLAVLEKRPVEGGAASETALEAFGREMDALRKEIDAQRLDTADARAGIAAMMDEAAARLESAEKDAERQREVAAESARQTVIRTAIGRVQAAIEGGGALESALSDLSKAGVDVPPALSEQAQGVPSLIGLREAFPPAARTALSASLKEKVDGSMWSRITAFARSQSGARSLTPRAGDDPDAILSRAEAAVDVGDLATAISEVRNLPSEGQDRMAEWIALAERRKAAVDAIAALAAEYK